MKNKTTALWLTLLLGPLGLHRWYLKGRLDGISALLALPTLIGTYGVLRAYSLGLDDQISWVMIPFVGFSMAASALTAIVYGLSDAQKWNLHYNPQSDAQARCGQSGWMTVAGLVCALLLGSTVLLASIAFSFQRYFEYQAYQLEDSSTTPAAVNKSAD